MDEPLTPSTTIQTVDNQPFWVAIKTFYAQEQKVSDYLDVYQTKHFIPTLTSVTTDEEGKPQRTTRLPFTTSFSSRSTVALRNLCLS